MDPKALSNLDPKLKETYERVMGTQAPASTAAAPDVSPPPSAAPIAADAAPQPSASPFSAPPVQAVNPWQTAQSTAAPAAASPFATPGQTLPSPASITGAKDSSPLMRVLYIVGAVVFFVLYTIFWIKVFKLPFLF